LLSCQSEQSGRRGKQAAENKDRLQKMKIRWRFMAYNVIVLTILTSSKIEILVDLL
jgi:hypothetical protein